MSNTYKLQVQFETEHNKFNATSRAKDIARGFVENCDEVMSYTKTCNFTEGVKYEALVIKPLTRAVYLCLVNGEVNVNYMLTAISSLCEFNTEYTAGLLYLAVTNDLLNYDLPTQKFTLAQEIHPEDLTNMGKHDYPWPAVYQFKKLTNNFSNGSLTGKAGKSFIISRADPSAVFTINGVTYTLADCDFNLNNIDRLNAVKFTINHFPLEQLEDHIRDRKVDESYYDYETYRNQRINIQKYRGLISEEIGDLPVRFMHFYDRRGRVYPMGFHFNPQGNDYDKSLLSFAQGTKVPAGTEIRDPSTFKSAGSGREITTFNSLELLAIHITNLAGHDKKTYTERLTWFREVYSSENSIMDYLHDPVTKSTDSYASLTAASMEYIDIINGDSDTYHSVIQFDATASGPQIIAALMRSVPDAIATNVVATLERSDLYTKLYSQWSEHPDVRTRDIGEFNRKSFKDAIIPWFYGSSMVQKFLPEGTYNAFVEVAEKIIPGVVQYMRHFSLPLPEGTTHYGWVMPDGFVAHCPVISTEETNVYFCDSLCHIKLKVPYTYDKYHKGVAPNIIHSCDGYMVREITSALHMGPEVMAHMCEKLSKLSSSETDLQDLRLEVLDLIQENQRRKVFRHGLKLLSLAQQCGMLSVEILHDLTRSEDLWPVVELLIRDPKVSATALYTWLINRSKGASPYSSRRSVHDNFAAWFDFFNEYTEALSLTPLTTKEAVKAFTDISTIHDCFGGNGYNLNSIRKLYNLTMVRFCESWLLEKIHKDIFDVSWNQLTPGSQLSKGGLRRDMIINADYSLT